ncbi:hypothetical protein [Maribacter orientalis]|nr:hypothetical protein [Maribacter orientalis]
MIVFLFVVSFILSSSGLSGLLGDYGKAYADSRLYAIPMEIVKR